MQNLDKGSLSELCTYPASMGPLRVEPYFPGSLNVHVPNPPLCHINNRPIRPLTYMFLGITMNKKNVSLVVFLRWDCVSLAEIRVAQGVTCQGLLGQDTQK